MLGTKQELVEACFILANNYQWLGLICPNTLKPVIWKYFRAKFESIVATINMQLEMI